MKRDEALTVTENTELAAGIYRLRLERGSGDADLPQPGQFAMVQVREGVSPLLRRPISYLSADEKSVEFLYKVTGVGTRILKNVKHGDILNVLGPVGRGFDRSLAKSRAMLVAGGIGLPPLYFLAGELKKINVDNIELLYGAATENELVMCDELESSVTVAKFATDDGSYGYNGLVTELMKNRLDEKPPDVIYTCGPDPMLEAVAKIALEKDIPCQVSVEARMACGIGACLGCVVPDKDGNYLRVCEDGPVFASQELLGGASHG